MTRAGAAADRRRERVATAGGARWGSLWKAWLKQHGQSVGTLTAQCESLSYEHNYLDLDPVARDPFGMPVIRARTGSASPSWRARLSCASGCASGWRRRAPARPGTTSDSWSRRGTFRRHAHGR